MLLIDYRWEQCPYMPVNAQGPSDQPYDVKPPTFQ